MFRERSFLLPPLDIHVHKLNIFLVTVTPPNLIHTFSSPDRYRTPITRAPRHTRRRPT
jgi:hypothetical protein